jgi:hypothetical protein
MRDAAVVPKTAVMPADDAARRRRRLSSILGQVVGRMNDTARRGA